MFCAIDKVSGKTVDVIGSLRIALTDLLSVDAAAEATSRFVVGSASKQHCHGRFCQWR
jgi:hypothetical protein